MTSNKKYYWLKLKEDFFDEDTIAWIEEQDKGKEYCLFYLKLCLKSLKTNGLLIRNVGSMLVPYDTKQLAKITNTDTDTVIVAMELFKKIGLVQILENGEIYISQLQNMVGSETSKAQLMRNKRANDKKLLPSGNNVTNDGNNVTEGEENCYTEIEIEKDIEKDIDIDIELEKRDRNKDKKEENQSINHSLKEFKNLYEKNIGLINGLAAEWIIEISEIIEVDVFKKALVISTDKGRCNLGYVKGIISNWIAVNALTLQQVEAFEKYKWNKEVKSDVRVGKGITETESSTNDREDEAARRSELLRQIQELED